MAKVGRRSLLKSSAVLGLSAATYSRIARAAAFGAPPVVGFVGCGGRAQNLGGAFRRLSSAAWACDPDRHRAEKFQSKFKTSHLTSDLRAVLDDKSVDAVVIATPDHWHAPAAILACQAGKHVYVEKPCSHNFREGQLLVETARRNNVVVQHGTQSRSSRGIADAIQMLREGRIGDVLMSKAWNVQRRRNIGRAKPSNPPAHVDYDTWVGPAEFLPWQSNRFHYDWHWWHNFGTGDIGNDGTHEIDIARWGLQVSGLPSVASAIGGKLYFDDDQQFPDTATCVFQWPGQDSAHPTKQLIFEMRIWSKSYPHNVDTGIEFYGTDGMLFVSKRGKLMVRDNSNRLLDNPEPQTPLTLADSHQADFLDAIRNNRTPAADISIGHDSCSLVHLANISVRTGRSLSIDSERQEITNDAESTALLDRTYRADGHWSIPRKPG